MGPGGIESSIYNIPLYTQSYHLLSVCTDLQTLWLNRGKLNPLIFRQTLFVRAQTKYYHREDPVEIAKQPRLMLGEKSTL